MKTKDIDFPQYRKLSNEKVFYKIISEREFIEIQLMGTKAFKFDFIASKYPEILRIQDMLTSVESTFLTSTEDEFVRLINDYSL